MMIGSGRRRGEGWTRKKTKAASVEEKQLISSDEIGRRLYEANFPPLDVSARKRFPKVVEKFPTINSTEKRIENKHV